MNHFHRILIVGDSGRGKSTLAQTLSSKLNIKHYSTDDFYWKVEFTVTEDKKVCQQKISKIYQHDAWIIEGSTRSLIAEGITKSDLILYLTYPNLIFQFWFLFKRYLGRPHEKLINLLRLYRHLIYKRYQIGTEKNKPSLDQLLSPHDSKVVRLESFRAINQFVASL